MINFAADSLFCEFAYVIDYDANTFEMFKGFNKEPVPEGQRFADLPREVNPRTHEVSEYYPVVLANTWALDNLPTEEEFLLQTTEED